MEKAYERINWKNYPDDTTPLNERNLNLMDSAVDEIDNRVLILDEDKATIQQISGLIRNVTVDDATGIMTLTKYNGSTIQIQTTLNKIAVNFVYDYSTQTLILTMNDGTTANIDLSSLIQNNEFDDTDTIDFTVGAGGHVSAIVVEHSIGDEHLRTDYLADIRVSEANAAQSEQISQHHQFTAEAWAIGMRDSQPVPSTDVTYNNNSKYYTGRSEAWARGTVDNTDVPSTDRAYHNNSKYYSDLSASIRDATENIKNQAQEMLTDVTNRLTGLNMFVNYGDGCLYYDITSGIQLTIDSTTGNLMYEIIV